MQIAELIQKRQLINAGEIHLSNDALMAAVALPS